MKRQPYFATLGPTDLVYTPAQPTFSHLTQSSLGNAGDTSDGFDGELNSTLAALNAADAILKAIDHGLGALDAQQTALDRIPTADIDGQIAVGQAADAAASISLGTAIGGLNFSASSVPGLAPEPQPPLYSVPGIGIGQSVGTPGQTPLEKGLTEATQATALGATIGIAAHLSATFAAQGSALAAILGPVATFAPIVGAFVGLGLLLMQFIGKGCGAPCTEAAKTEQIYEAWADNMLALFRLGMVTKDQALAGMALAMEYGAQHEGNYNDKQARAGTANLQRVIQALVNGMAHTTGGKKQPYNQITAHQAYTSGPGWYPDSLAAADQLTDEYVTSLH